jgi:dihydrofolate reductase
MKGLHTLPMTNYIYIATSLDGFIADKDGGLDFLDQIPNPEQSDFGFGDFMASVDALVMGSTTYETVLGFDIAWPYSKPVFVLSNRLTEVPEELVGKVELMRGAPAAIVARLEQRGYGHLYIDGGAVIQSFLHADLIDELIITTMPVLLGGGAPLFGELAQPLWLEHVETNAFAGGQVMSRYRRVRK